MSASSRGEFKMALSSVMSTKWRSMLTVLGVVIGVASVMTVMGLGQGIKQQIAGQIDHFGKNILMVRPGNQARYENGTQLTNTDVLFGRDAMGALTTQDAAAIASVGQVQKSAPLGIISSAAKVGNTTLSDPLVIATSSQLPSVIGQQVQYGNFFDDNSANTAVIGKQVAHDLFGESVPLGQLFTLRGQTFMVRGIFSDFNSSPMSPTAGFDNAIFIPYGAAQQLTNNGLQFYTILVQPKSGSQASATQNITSHLLAAHGGEHDFTVFNHSQAEDMSKSTISLFTTFVSAVAAIALLVGGIGIMNIMLVSVTERMHEIGVRKAVGATNRQILTQFTLEAAVLSGVGGVIGVVLSIIAEALLRTYTTYHPVFMWQAMLLAVGISLAVGIVFGVAPAVKAARKDPITALRHE
ncbi:MAG TPA: ABC transporter permease [Candidatus Saccharimonadales bacterium]|nr:ABC transporter permease [Candidatus Saccharimonadales bacterium]